MKKSNGGAVSQPSRAQGHLIGLFHCGPGSDPELEIRSSNSTKAKASAYQPASLLASTQTTQTTTQEKKDIVMAHHISGVGAFFIIVLFLIIASACAWIIYTHLRARRLGLPQPTLSSYNPFNTSQRSYGAPSPAPGGIVGWVNDKVRAFRNRGNRSAGGAYEEPLSSNVRGRANNRGFGPLDPDDAWDARVGTEADAYGPGGYYEEQELGLHGGGGGGASAGLAPTPGMAPPGYGEGSRGRSLGREPEPYIGGSQAGLDRRYDEEMVTGKKPATNPFDDTAEPSNVSLRGVSPRPIDTSKGHLKQDSLDNSPTERRSMFRENM
jgi:hypothetical protein